MAMVVKCARFLRASASLGFSSAKLSPLSSSSSSVVSSILAQSILPRFKGPNLRQSSMFGLVNTFARARHDEPPIEAQDYYVKRNKLEGELAQNKKKIEGLIAIIELTCTELSRAVESLQKIEQKSSAEPETENHKPPPKPERSNFLGLNHD